MPLVWTIVSWNHFKRVIYINTLFMAGGWVLFTWTLSTGIHQCTQWFFVSTGLGFVCLSTVNVSWWAFFQIVSSLHNYMKSLHKIMDYWIHDFHSIFLQFVSKGVSLEFFLFNQKGLDVPLPKCCYASFRISSQHLYAQEKHPKNAALDCWILPK